MCGIFIYKGVNQDGEKQVWEGLKKLEYRGYDSFGIYGRKDGKENLQKFIGKVSGEKIAFKDATLSLGHTRWATHGKVEERNSHPHISNSQRFILVHNGIFENYLPMKKILSENGYKFYSETDTEVLVNFIEQAFLKMKVNKRNLFLTVKEVSKSIKGSNAFSVLDKVTEEIVCYKNGSPLFLGKGQDSFFVSSDHIAFPNDALNFCELKDGEVISTLNLSKVKWQKIIAREENFSQGKYGHFMLKEIFDQKQTIQKSYEKNSSLATALSKDWFKNKKVFATGCGTAHNAAQIFSILAAKKNIFVKTVAGNEWEQVENLINKDSILFCFSQSGETIDLLLFAKKFKEKGGKVYSVLNREFSTLKNISDKYFAINSGQEIAVASTKAFTGMVLSSFKLLDFKIEKRDFKEIEKFLNNMKNFSELDQIIQKYANSSSMFVLGKGLEEYIAKETALKIKEVSYIHSEGFASGELKHGVIALIEPGVLSIVLGGNDKYLSDLENSATQITSRGGDVFFIGTKKIESASENFIIPKSKVLGPVFSTIVGQILAYKFAVAKGLNPDKPRNLAKSVTVK